MRRQNPLELVFEDISTFDAENPIVRSLLREIDLKKKQTDSDFVKSLPSHPGKEFEIKKRLDKLRGLDTSDNIYNNNNKNNIDFGEPPSLPSIEDFLDGGPRPPQPPPPPLPPSFNGDLFNKPNVLIPPPSTEDFNVKINKARPTIWKKGIENNLFGSQAQMKGPRETEKTSTQNEIDVFLYELPEKKIPELELSDGLLNSLGTAAKTIFDDSIPTQKEEEEEILKDIFDEYNLNDIKNTIDEKGEVPESLYFFYGGDSEQSVQALEFIGLSPINREFAAFLLSNLGLKTMTQNKLSIYVESGEIFYHNHNTGENFYNFLLSQQNDKAAYVPKKFSYRNSFETYISSF